MNRRIAANHLAQLDAPRDGQGVGGDAVAAKTRRDEDPVDAKSPPSKKQPASKDPKDKPDRSRRGKPGDVGNLLRGAYRQTIDEAIPDDLMDLLNKLE